MLYILRNSHYHIPMRIKCNDSLCLIIDIQERLFPHMACKEDLLRNTLVLLEGLKVLKVPVIFTEQYRKGLGPTIPEIISAADSFMPLEKSSFSCMDDKGIREALKNAGKKFVILAGIESHVCVLQTAIDLLEQGYVPVIVEDCVSSRHKASKETALRRLVQAGAVPATAETILFELLRYSGTEDFKKISRIIK